MKSSNKSHLCPLCEKKYWTSSHLKRHMETHTRREKLFKCDVCAKGHFSKSALNLHKATHSNLRSYQCQHPGCNKTFKRSGDLSRHKWTHRVDRRFECIFCKQTYREREQLFHHLNAHTREKPYFCEECGCEKPRLDQAKAHYMLYHTNERPYKCDSCPMTFLSRPGLSIHHRRIHDKVPVPKFPRRCVDCGESFVDHRALAKHKVVHTGIPKPHKCSLCNKGFWGSGELNRHIRSHTRERPHKCDICLQGFILASSLGSHRKIHETDREKHSCPQCGKIFLAMESVRKHIKTVHEGQQPHQCTFCQAKRSDKKHLFTHLLSHISEKPFICDVCLHESSSERTATTHYIRCHAKQLPYGCEFCGKRYTTARGLKDHQLLVHQQQEKISKSSFSIRDHLLLKEFISR